MDGSSPLGSCCWTARQFLFCSPTVWCWWRGSWPASRRGRGGPETGPETQVILLDGVLRRNNPLLRALTPLGQVREFRPLRGEALARWVRERVSRGGCSITPGAVRLVR